MPGEIKFKFTVDPAELQQQVKAATAQAKQDIAAGQVNDYSGTNNAFATEEAREAAEAARLARVKALLSGPNKGMTAAEKKAAEAAGGEEDKSKIEAEEKARNKRIQKEAFLAWKQDYAEKLAAEQKKAEQVLADQRQALLNASIKARAAAAKQEAAEQKKVEQEKKEKQDDSARFWRNAGFAAMPVQNPLSPLGNFAAARQTFKAFSTTQTGAEAMGAVGLSGTGGAAIAAGVVTGAAMAVGLALLALRKTIMETVQSAEYARSTYARALQSGGLGLGVTQSRSSIAGIIGVGEQELLAYGRAMEYVGSRTKNANRILTETNPALTSLAWELGILQLNMRALWAEVAVSLAPTIQLAVEDLNRLVVTFTNIMKEADGFSSIMKGLADIISSILLPFGSFVKLLTDLKEEILNPLGLTNASKASKAPPIDISTKQLPTAAWEKMGLVVAMGAQQSPLIDIRANTRRSADALERMAPRGGGIMKAKKQEETEENMP